MSQPPLKSLPPTTMNGKRLLVIWLAFAGLLLMAPQMFSSGTAVSLLSQMGTAMIFGLSYNMLLGQGGMLSFGHAVYAGLGAFTAVHAMNLAGGGQIWLPLPLVPVVGGVAGMLFAALIGYVTTRKSGTTFAMITLGVGQMVFACALMFPAFFGGEGGISTNRVYGEKFFGLNFGSQLQVYFLIATWLFLCTAAIFAFTQTPLGRILNAVRDNAERTAFIGYDPQLVRYLALVLSGFFAGVSGALGAINFEIATAENLGLARSGDVLLFTFIGGINSFIGPMVGAVVGVLMTVMLSDHTQAWHMYLGLLFILVVVYAPEGLVSLWMPARQLISQGLTPQTYLRLIAALASALLILVGAVMVIEMLYHRTSGAEDVLTLFGYGLDHRNPWVWLICCSTLITGVLTIKPCARWVRQGIDHPKVVESISHERSVA